MELCATCFPMARSSSSVQQVANLVVRPTHFHEGFSVAAHGGGTVDVELEVVPPVHIGNIAQYSDAVSVQA